MYPRHRLDLKPRHLAYAAAACVWAHDPDRLEAEIERDASGERLVCFSVRSAFELLLDALDFEPGAEILMSAITHPDMARIVERHGLVAVPVELDLETLQPRTDGLEAAITSKTRAFLFAHLFGVRADLDAAVAFCKRHDLLLVEDCAQTLRSPSDSGDPRSDAALFSFGSIKTAPALGGGVACVRDPALHESMRRIEARWPRQGRGEYAKRVARFAGLLMLGRPLVYEGFVRGGRRFGLDVDALVNRSVHALKPPSGDQRDEFGEWVRRRASAPLLALLRRRLTHFDHDRLRKRTERGERAAQALPGSVFHPGRAAPDRTHWVFPVACHDPRRAIETLRQAGFDATAATSSIAAVEAPSDRPDLQPKDSIDFMEHVLFVPVYPELPERAFRRLLQTLSRLEDDLLREVRPLGEPGEAVRS